MQNLKFILISELLKSTKTLCLSSYFSLFLSIIVFINLPSSFLSTGIIIFLMVMLLIQHYFYIRIEFDSNIFKHLSLLKNTETDTALNLLDDTFFELDLVSDKKSKRTLIERFKGCKKLLKNQIILIALQYVGLIILILSYSSFELSLGL